MLDRYDSSRLYPLTLAAWATVSAVVAYLLAHSLTDGRTPAIAIAAAIAAILFAAQPAVRYVLGLRGDWIEPDERTMVLGWLTVLALGAFAGQFFIWTL